MSNAIVFDRTVKMMEDRLSQNSINQKLVSGNIANMNTPGYRTRELSFDKALRESLQEEVLQMVRSNKTHAAPQEPVEQMNSPEVVESGPVDLDTEMVKLVRNSIEYQYIVNMMNKRFTMIKYAIAEGGM